MEDAARGGSPRGSRQPPRGLETEEATPAAAADPAPVPIAEARGASAYETLLAEEHCSPLELAVFAKLRAWESGADGGSYTHAQMLEVTRFMEAKLAPKTLEKHKKAQHHLAWLDFEKRTVKKCRFCLARRWKRRLPKILAFLGVFLALGSVVGLTVAAARLSRSISLEASGQISGAGVGAVGTGAAVQLHSMDSYPSLPFQDLRRISNIVLRQAGHFCVFRLASVTQLPAQGGRAGVRFTAEDGTLITVEDHAAGNGTVAHATIRRPWESDVEADKGDAHNLGKDAWAVDGAVFVSMSTLPELVGDTGLPAPTERLVDER